MNNNRQLFSIGIVCYRNWEYLENAIDSVLSQDYPRIQLIVSDDGSDGFPVEQYRNYIEEHKKGNLVDFVVRQSTHNEGTVCHLNRVFDTMDGQYVMFMAADDMLDHKEVFSQYAKAFASEGEDCGCIVAQTAMYDSTMTDLQEYYVMPNVIEAINKSDETDDLLQNLFFLPCLPTTTMVFRNSLIKQMGPFDTDYKLIEDYPFHLKLANEHVKMRFYDFVGARHRDGGISHGADKALSKSKQMYFDDIIRCRKTVLRMSEHAGIEERVRKFCKWQIRETDYQLKTSGKKLRDQRGYIKENPSYYFERKLSDIAPVSEKKLFVILALLIALIWIPEHWIQNFTQPQVMTALSILRWVVLAIVAIVFVGSILINRYKESDGMP